MFSKELRKILDDLTSGRYISSYITSFLGIAVVIASVFTDIQDDLVLKIVLAVVSILLYSIILERREKQKLFEKIDIQGISAFRDNRSDLPKFDFLLRSANKQIDLLAIIHNTLTHSNLGILEEKAKQGCKIRILILSAFNSDGTESQVYYDILKQRPSYFSSINISRLNSNTNILLNWHSNLLPNIQSKIEIKAYLEFPTTTITIIDRDEIEGYLLAELLLYKFPTVNIPHYIVKKKEGKVFFDNHCKSFDELWKNSFTPHS